MLFFGYNFRNGASLSWARDGEWPVASAIVVALSPFGVEAQGASNTTIAALAPSVDVTGFVPGNMAIPVLTPGVAVNMGHRVYVGMEPPSAIGIASVSTGASARIKLAPPIVSARGASKIAMDAPVASMDAVVDVGAISASGAVGVPAFGVDIVASAQVDAEATVTLAAPGVSVKVRKVSRYSTVIVEHEEALVDLWIKGTIGAPSFGVSAELS